jgi:ZF-HD homeobox protein with Cys/His-rich dimerization domain
MGCTDHNHEVEHENEESSPTQLVPPDIVENKSFGKKHTSGGGGSAVVVKYGECPKNHAAAMGNTTDRCDEFMPSGKEGSLKALKCSACVCHCNFHHKEVNDEDVLGYVRHHLITLALPQCRRLSSQGGSCGAPRSA